MAKFSQQFLKSMSSPGLFEMGVANLGDKLSDMRLRQRQTRESENIQQILQANINNPAKLQQLAQEYQIKGNAAAAAAFQDAAKRATAVETEQETALQNKGEIALFNMARMMQSDPSEDISRNDRKRQNYLSVAEGYKVSPERALEILEQSVEKDKEGSKATVKTTTQTVVENGKSVIYAISTDPYTGEEVARVKIGDAPSEEKEKVGRGSWKNPEIEAYTTAVTDQRSAAAEAVKYDSLLRETIEIAGESGGVPLPYVGGFLGATRDFVIADVAGLGDAITSHRARLNEVRMQNAIALLPRGPASDRDVKLALDANVDPKNLKPEDRVAYIRGMKKLADVEKEYMDGKLRWIEQTGDALAFGYERKVSLDGYGKQIDALRLDNSTEVAVLDDLLKQANDLNSTGQTQAARDMIQTIRQQDTLGYLDLIEAEQLERRRYEAFIEDNNITFN